VVGADVYVRDVERALRPKLRVLGSRAALVNAQGRVIVSNSVRQVTGTLVREVDVPAWWMTQAPLRGRHQSAAMRGRPDRTRHQRLTLPFVKAQHAACVVSRVRTCGEGAPSLRPAC
jgi:hypothetical protein